MSRVSSASARAGEARTSVRSVAWRVTSPGRLMLAQHTLVGEACSSHMCGGGRSLRWRPGGMGPPGWGTGSAERTDDSRGDRWGARRGVAGGAAGAPPGRAVFPDLGATYFLFPGGQS